MSTAESVVNFDVAFVCHVCFIAFWVFINLRPHESCSFTSLSLEEAPHLLSSVKHLVNSVANWIWRIQVRTKITEPSVATFPLCSSGSKLDSYDDCYHFGSVLYKIHDRLRPLNVAVCWLSISTNWLNFDFILSAEKLFMSYGEVR